MLGIRLQVKVYSLVNQGILESLGLPGGSRVAQLLPFLLIVPSLLETRVLKTMTLVGMTNAKVTVADIVMVVALQIYCGSSMENGNCKEL